jgi:hypothetical protein
MSGTPFDSHAKEGWAAAVVDNLFHGMRTQHPKQFAADVQFVYDWESSIKGGTRNDPLNLRAHSDFASPHDAMIATLHLLHTKQDAGILAAMQKGDYDAAKRALSVHHVTVGGKSKMPSKIDTKTGSYAPSGVPSTWDEILGTLGGMPGQAGKDLGGIGGLLSGHMVLIVVIIVAIVVLKKK